MEVILREHVDNLGRRGEVVKVADGYARNYLLPRKLALLVTDGNKKQIERERAKFDAKEAEERKVVDAVAERLANVEVVIARRVGDTEALYGSVTTADIAEALAAKGFDIDKRKLQLAEPIKKVGEVDGAGEAPSRRHRSGEGARRCGRQGRRVDCFLSCHAGRCCRTHAASQSRGRALGARRDPSPQRRVQSRGRSHRLR